MVCPFCATVAEYAAGDLIQHILAEHPKEAAVMGVALPAALVLFKRSWPTVVVGGLVIAIILASFGRGRGFGYA